MLFIASSNVIPNGAGPSDKVDRCICVIQQVRTCTYPSDHEVRPSVALVTGRCNACGEYIYHGRKFNARKETVEGERYLGIPIFRFYIRCTRCLSEITFKVSFVCLLCSLCVCVCVSGRCALPCCVCVCVCLDGVLCPAVCVCVDGVLCPAVCGCVDGVLCPVVCVCVDGVLCPVVCVCVDGVLCPVVCG